MKELFISIIGRFYTSTEIQHPGWIIPNEITAKTRIKDHKIFAAIEMYLKFDKKPDAKIKGSRGAR